MIGRFVVGFLATVTALLVVLALAMGVTGWQAMSSAKELERQLASAQTQGKKNPIAAAAGHLPEIQKQSAAVSSSLNSLPWKVAAGLPVLGDTAYSLGAISEAVAGTLAAAPTRPGAGSEVAALSSVHFELEAMSQAANSYEAQVGAVWIPGVVDPLRSQVAEARDQYFALQESADALAGAAAALPKVLGYQGERRWLVVLQNPAEARGTGGLIGAYVLAKVKDGKLSADAADSNNSLSHGPISLKGIPQDTRKLWGDDLAHLWGLNLDRHFPYATTLLPRLVPDEKIDDIVSLDPHAVAALLRSTGPVSAHGSTVNHKNAVAFFTKTVYEKYPDKTEKDAVVVALLEAVLSKIAGADDGLVRFWSALNDVIAGEHVLLASTQPNVQHDLARLTTSGVVPQGGGPWTTVGVNDFAGSKFDAYIHVEARYESGSLCTEEGHSSVLVVTARNAAPANLAAYADLRNDKGGGKPGSTKINVSLYAPVGAGLGKVRIDGKAGGVKLGTDRNHPVWQRSLVLERGETRELRVEFDEPFRPDRPAKLVPQPMVNTMKTSVASSCS